MLRSITKSISSIVRPLPAAVVAPARSIFSAALPSVTASTSRVAVLRAPALLAPLRVTVAPAPVAASTPFDELFSTGLRFATFRTYQPSLVSRRRRHGYLRRQRTHNGRRVLTARRNKGRKFLVV